MTQYQYPFPLDTITTDFGAVDSEHPNPHRGTDFAPGGLPIPAVSDGVVVRDERQAGLGNVVTVRADDGIFWACSHMAARTPFNVGDRVARGDTVGVVGNTGSLTTGRHLHFTMSPSSDDPAFGVVFDCIPYITARLASTAGGGTTPFPTDKRRTDEMPQRYQLKSNPNKLALAGHVGAAVPGNWDEYVRDDAKDGNRAPYEFKQYGEARIVEQAEWDRLKKLYTTGSPVGDITVTGSQPADFKPLADAIISAINSLPSAVATAINTDTAKRLAQ